MQHYCFGIPAILCPFGYREQFCSWKSPLIAPIERQNSGWDGLGDSGECETGFLGVVPVFRENWWRENDDGKTNNIIKILLSPFDQILITITAGRS
jgi:hypothetical protein